MRPDPSVRRVRPLRRLGHDMTSFAKLDQPAPGRLTIRYRPDADDRIAETPPRFSWLPDIDRTAEYVLRVSRDPGFPKAKTEVWTGIPLNFFTPDRAFEPGTWHWSYALWEPEAGKRASDWSAVRSFEIGADLPQTPLPSRTARREAASRAHPRLWLTPETLGNLRETVATSPESWGWDRFWRASVLPWMDVPVMEEPLGYPGNRRTAEVWRQTYIACQELLYAIRHLAIGGQVSRDAAMIDRAKAWLLAAAAWDPQGTTSRGYSDEWAFRVNAALAWGYDWLHDELDEAERARVRDALVARTRDTADHVIRNANIGLCPFDSHAVRAVSAVLVPASIALLHEAEEAQDWLDFAVEFLFTVYSPWGDADGGWAEGPHYWMTGMAYLIEAGTLLRNYIGLDLFARPFFRRTADFPVFTRAPHTRRATFGDDATLGDALSLKMATNVRHFAGVTGNPAWQWYHDRVRAADTGTEKAFYNWGWWDFNFDDLVFAHDHAPVEPAPPDPADRLRHFRGIGWVCIQNRPDDLTRHVQFNFKSSPFGSISHSHADQNAFCLSAFGEDLAIRSGHYVAFGSSMHRDWQRQTRSKNAVLIDGQGQYAGDDKARAIRAAGRILHVDETAERILMSGDATAAYAEVDSAIRSVLREIHFVHDSFFVIVDTVEASRAVTLDWLLHAPAEMALGPETFRYEGPRAGFYGQVLYCEAGTPTLSQETGFPGVDPAEIAGLETSTCLKVQCPAARRHRLATLLVPYPADAPRRVFSFLDDQGFAANLYFTDACDRSYRITLEKIFERGAETDTQR